MEIEGLGGAESPWAMYYEALKIFRNRKFDIHVIDGENLIKNPNIEFKGIDTGTLPKWAGVFCLHCVFEREHDACYTQ